MPEGSTTLLRKIHLGGNFPLLGRTPPTHDFCSESGVLFCKENTQVNVFGYDGTPSSEFGADGTDWPGVGLAPYPKDDKYN